MNSLEEVFSYTKEMMSHKIKTMEGSHFKRAIQKIDDYIKDKAYDSLLYALGIYGISSMSSPKTAGLNMTYLRGAPIMESRPINGPIPLGNALRIMTGRCCLPTALCIWRNWYV